jgi:hypothetical protein
MSKYFANKEAPELVDVALSKYKDFFSFYESSGYLTKVKKLYAMYYGMNSDGSGDHQINFNGENGELLSINVNHIRNFANYMLNLVTSSRPTMEARAINADVKSIVQTKLANGLLDYYMREKKLEKKLIKACELAIATGAGYIRHEWNATSGERVGFDEETQTPIYEGDINYNLLNQFSVAFDKTKENFDDQDWLIVCTFKNRHDLIAKWPEYESELLALPSKSEMDINLNMSDTSESTDDIPVYEFFHKRTDAVPDGRYLIFASREAIFVDVPLPYQEIPIYRITASDILGTSLGYTPLFDLMPMQDSVNMLYSTILTNNYATGVQLLFVPRNAGISIEALGEGLSIIEGNAKPEPLQLTSTAKETYEFLSVMVSTMETISGINSVVRGQPDANIRSGSSMALLQANSIQYMSGLAMQYNQLIEDVGTGLLQTLKMYANTKRVASIVGKTNVSYLQEYSQEDLSNIKRVVVSAGNPLMKTTAGRFQMASDLLQYQLLKDPSQYFAIMNGAPLDVITDAPTRQLNLILSENEKMLEGKYPPVIITDKHVEHIDEHLGLLDDAKMRENPELIQLVLDHVNEHKMYLETGDPFLLQIRGQQSLAQPPAGQPPQMSEMEESKLPTPAKQPEIPLEGANANPLPTTPQQLQANIAR